MKPISKQIVDIQGIKTFTSKMIAWDSAASLNIPTKPPKKPPKTTDIKNNNPPFIFLFHFHSPFSLAKLFAFFSIQSTTGIRAK